MKKLFAFLLCLAGCTPKTTPVSNASLTILPIRQGQVSYTKTFNRFSISPAEANARTQQWIATHYTLLDLHPALHTPEKPDLIYSGNIAGRRFYDRRGERIIYPPINFQLAVVNQPDSSKIWVTNLEVYDKTQWIPLNQGQFSNTPFAELWLSDVDATLQDVMIALRQRLER
ncbi:hypothetical protein WBJ53_16160 [Spirosoma sp. SC4-14]|uniref:hypothetical protein n=1 Tax=Spirosoma sp. SC4-14 TaxID=3128900 RepID=UPI0030CEF69A